MSATIDSTTRKSMNSPAALGPHDWDAWRQHLSTRQEPRPLGELFTCSTNSPLSWALPTDMDTSSLEKRFFRWNSDLTEAKSTSRKRTTSKGKKRAKSSSRTHHPSWVDELEDWLGSVAKQKSSQQFAYECLAWCQLLPQLVEQLPAAPWMELCETIVEIAGSADQLSVLDHPLQHTLLAGELGLTLGYLFPELESCRKLQKPSRKALSLGTIELLDGEGLPHVSDLPVFRSLLASWARCSRLSEAHGKDCFSPDARQQFEWGVRQAIYLTRNNRSQLFAPSITDGTWHTGCEAILQAGGNDVDWLMASRSLLKTKQKTRHRQRYQHLDRQHLPDPSVHSEWSEITVMRTNWRNSGSQLAVSHDQPTMTTELIRGRQPLWQGDWSTSIAIDGKPLDLGEEWDVVCWFSDEDADYLELEIELHQDWKLQRQILMAREDRFLYQADILLGNKEAQIDYCAQLPLSPDVSFQPADKTHDGVLTSAQHNALVFPLACPEWRTESSPGKLQESEGKLQYQLQTTARNLYAPLFIDLSKSGSTKPFTWRRLTIAHLLEIQSAGAAAGYRVQIGSRQWFFYRSLDPPANRTVLGQNLTSEFLAGRFYRQGEVHKFVEIE